MTIKVEEYTLPSAWASYLVNGDASGLEQYEIDACDARVAKLAGHYVDVVEGSERFTWSFALHSGRMTQADGVTIVQGGDVSDFVFHVTD